MIKPLKAILHGRLQGYLNKIRCNRKLFFRLDPQDYIFKLWAQLRIWLLLQMRSLVFKSGVICVWRTKHPFSTLHSNYCVHWRLQWTNQGGRVTVPESQTLDTKSGWKKEEKKNNLPMRSERPSRRWDDLFQSCSHNRDPEPPWLTETTRAPHVTYP